MAVVPDAKSGLRAARSGASVVQLRAPQLTIRDLEIEAEILVDCCPAPVLISSRVDVALAVGAAGVNLPESDLAVTAARRLLGPNREIGRSVHSLEGAQAAQAAGADFVIFGPVFDTPTHLGQAAAGLATLGEIARSLSIPVLAIGGINRERIPLCLAAGVAGCAAIGMFAADRA